MSKEDTSIVVDRIGKDFMGLPQKEALMVLLTAATYYSAHYVPASHFSEVWEDMGNTVHASAVKMAPLFLATLTERVGNA